MRRYCFFICREAVNCTLEAEKKTLLKRSKAWAAIQSTRGVHSTSKAVKCLLITALISLTLQAAYAQTHGAAQEKLHQNKESQEKNMRAQFACAIYANYMGDNDQKVVAQHIKNGIFAGREYWAGLDARGIYENPFAVYEYPWLGVIDELEIGNDFNVGYEMANQFRYAEILIEKSCSEKLNSCGGGLNQSATMLYETRNCRLILKMD